MNSVTSSNIKSILSSLLDAPHNVTIANLRQAGFRVRARQKRFLKPTVPVDIKDLKLRKSVSEYLTFSSPDNNLTWMSDIRDLKSQSSVHERGGETHVIISSSDGAFSSEASVTCSRHDQFVRKIGLDMAVSKAVTSLYNDVIANA